MSLKGNLKSFSLPEIFQSLSLSRHTGTLKIRQAAHDGVTRTRYIHFAEGQITFVSPESPKGFRIGDILYRLGKLTRPEIEDALRVQKQTGEKLGNILTKQGKVSSKDIDEALKAQVKEEIYDLFLLKDAEFEFKVQEDPPLEAASPLHRVLQLKLDPQAVIMEGMKRLDEWSVLKTHIKTGDEIFIPTGTEPEQLEHAESMLYAVIDGVTPVNEIYPKVPLGRFSSAKAIFNLLTAGLIRPLSPEELKELAAQEPGERKPLFLRFALQQEPENSKLRTELADIYVSIGEEDSALQILKGGLSGELQLSWQQKLEISEKVLRLAYNSEEALRTALQAATNLEMHERAVKYAATLSDVLRKRNQAEAAKSVLLEVNGNVPDIRDLRLTMASKWYTLGEPEASIPHLEALAELLETEGDRAELSKVLNWILEADPSRADVRHRLAQITQRQEKEKEKKKRKLVLTAALGILLAVLATIVIVYQKKAQLAYAKVARKKGQLLEENRFSESIQLYRDFITSYRWSFWAPKAKEALPRLRELKKEYEKRKQQELRETRALRERIKNMPKQLKKLAEKKEKEGDLERANDLLRTLVSRFPHSPQAKQATLVLRIASCPSGAEVLVKKKNEEEPGAKLERIGKTPLRIRYKPGRKFSLLLRHKGCKDKEWHLQEPAPSKVRIQLPWTSVGSFSYKVPVRGKIEPAGSHIIFSCRKGYLYVLSLKESKITWRRKMGHYGDPYPRFARKGQCIVAGDIRGRLVAMDIKSGKALWNLKLPAGGQVFPLIDSKGTVFAATRTGHIFRLREDKIEAARKLALEGRCLVTPAVKNGVLVAGSSTDFCFGFHASDLSAMWRKCVDSDVTGGPVVYDNTVAVTTKRNRVYGLNLQTGEKLWSIKLPAPLSASCLATDSGFCFPLENGKLHTVSPGGKTVSKVELGPAPIGNILSHGRTLFFGNAEGTFSTFDIYRQQVLRSFETSAGISARPCMLGGKILFATVQGDFFLMENFP